MTSGRLNNQMPTIDMDNYLPDNNTLAEVPESLATRFAAIPLFRYNNTLVIAMADPNDYVVINSLKKETNADIYPIAGQREAILKAIEVFYQNIDSLQDDMRPILQEIRLANPEKTQELKDSVVIEEKTPMIKLVNLIIGHAIKIGASDLHLEPGEFKVRLRYRIDGVMQELATLSTDLLSGLVSRIKIISDLDISENRLPQDGRAKLTVNDNQVDLRVSAFPTIFGENIVIRILNRDALNLNLETLGFPEQTLERFDKAIHSPYGIVLVSGPTGSGKTTTLYSVLSRINDVHKNIITVEDPVEYGIDLVRQAQIRPRIGLTFAAGLRSILRQDPDIIMVGEIRDLETSEIAIQAALTGHLVFSTIHTNDAPSTIPRMTNMGIEPFLLSTSLTAVLAQRLVRRICPDCKTAYTPEKRLIKELELPEGTKLYKGEGCLVCRKTGYRGRLGLFELLTVNEEIRKLIINHATGSEIQTAAQKNGMKTLFEDGVDKALSGQTTMEEVFRVTRLKE